MSASKNPSSIKTKCAYDALVDTDKLIPNPRNPNKHPPAQLDLLAKIIKYQGFRNPIVVSNRSGFIVKGHARLEAAKLLELPQCPVDYQDYDNEAEEWADMIADNRLAELAETSIPELKDLLQELDTGAFDMDLTGFDRNALEELMTQFHVWAPDADLLEGAGEQKARVLVVFMDDHEALAFWALFGRSEAPPGRVVFRWSELQK